MDLILLWLLGGLFFLPFGGGFATTETEVAPVPSAAASPAVDPIEEQFDRRPELTSCGWFLVESGPFESSAQPGWQCLDQVGQEVGAEAVFEVSGTTTVSSTTYVRVADGVMEIYGHEQSADSWEAWTYDSCSTEVASFRQGCP